jgi:hypothetical protein
VLYSSEKRDRLLRGNKHPPNTLFMHDYVTRSFVLRVLLGQSLILSLESTVDTSVKTSRVPCCVSARIWLYKDLTTHPVVQYVAWISLPLFLILFSAGFVHIVAPQSIGTQRASVSARLHSRLCLNMFNHSEMTVSHSNGRRPYHRQV